ncbi:PilN domain-containing protein [Arenimonas fontis]|uniref:PilN domain-containing protein n=1 Tax=Arenimonas fontis TaxID=2608255 RepID=A0A5B2ZD35_9GAMM|nr:PilN domain-containing protein [Arenimonas fontis]KAA2284981.1 PilN domain-containing protein [Arenimonas fontis]
MPAANRLTTFADDLRLRLLRSRLPALWQATLDDLRGLLPRSWRRLLEGERQALWLRHAGDRLELRAHGTDGQTSLGELPLRPAVLEALADRIGQHHLRTWLLLPQELVLRRRLLLPGAAEPRLREVLGFELDRQTPFSAAQVVYEGRVLARGSGPQGLQVELLVLPRARLEAELQALGPLADLLSGVDVEEDGRRLGLNLLAAAGRSAPADPVRRTNAWLLAGAGAALMLALALILHNRGERLESMRAAVAAATEQARDARRIRNRLQSTATAANYLAERRAARPTMLELLDDLSRRIPDDTALDKLAVNGDRVVMVGQSRSAPALVGLLQASPLLTEPALSGAVQADSRSGRDRFTLVARLRPPAEEGDGRSP